MAKHFFEVTRSENCEPVTTGHTPKDLDSIVVPGGNIILIHFIHSKWIRVILAAKFKVTKDVMYSYVKAVTIKSVGT
jgi:hypothetical protein